MNPVTDVLPTSTATVSGARRNGQDLGTINAQGVIEKSLEHEVDEVPDPTTKPGMDNPDNLLTHDMNYHFRLFSLDNELLARGGVSVVYRLDKEGNVSFGVSVCSPFDAYCRKIGREAAAGRAVRSSHVSDTPLTYDQARVVAWALATRCMNEVAFRLFESGKLTLEQFKICLTQLQPKTRGRSKHGT